MRNEISWKSEQIDTFGFDEVKRSLDSSSARREGVSIRFEVLQVA
jgi:hypothetical protein